MKHSPDNKTKSPDEIIEYYSKLFSEAERLFLLPNRLELVRTQEILDRYLPPPPAVILDVGGGPGVYTCWLLGKGYEVHLIDPVPLHIEQTRKAIAQLPGRTAASASVGNALRLDCEDESADVILFMGPLYHLTEKEDRLRALAEAHRVLRVGGLLFGVGISRFASLLDGLNRGLLFDPQFEEIVRRDLSEGQHRNPTDNPEYWTDAYSHHPDELEAEIREAGFDVEALLSIEGPGWALKDHERLWQDADLRKRVLEFLRTVESDRTLLGASPHIMAISRKC